MIKHLAHKIPTFTLTILFTSLILYLTLAANPLPQIDYTHTVGIDKVAHFLMMYGLTGIIAFDILKFRRNKISYKAPKPIILAIAAYTILLGGAIELIQGATDIGRTADVIDFTADALGSVAAFITILFMWTAVIRWYYD